ncbi:40S ribosomal protein S6, putative [Eimeria necatrix]|uniref:40S ribosomal protein S6 n=2 Tax=Eimeria necatrix TaxID=51315 RepID=U6MMR3_9EIME|nr:40S ribosomal protein S6, putative [Eimeria necatrix]CDJ62945.1 40S ribosomal protein S6, putative [Eimeria necatrix]
MLVKVPCGCFFVGFYVSGGSGANALLARMKLNIANPACGLQKTVEVDDEKKLLPFFERRMGAEVPGDSLGEEFKGYLFRITGGNDKQGFPMMQGILANHRVRLLFRTGMKCFRPRRTGERKRKSVRGAIVGPDLSVLNLVMLQKGPADIPGLTGGEKPRRLGPKRANHIRKLFNLGPEADVTKYVIRRKIEGKNKSKAPRIQRLVTESRIRRKRLYRHKVKKQAQASREALKEYKELLHKIAAEKRHKRHEHGKAQQAASAAPAVKTAPAAANAAAKTSARR